MPSLLYDIGKQFAKRLRFVLSSRILTVVDRLKDKNIEQRDSAYCRFVFCKELTGEVK